MDLQGKVALVTGASRGIGAQMAEELAQRGAKLFISWSASESGEARAKVVIDRIQSLGVDCEIHGLGVDLSQSQGPAQLMEACTKHYSQIDILVNNAGTDLLRDTAATTLQEYQYAMDLNLRAPFFLVQAALPHLRHPARIINISSMAARTGFPGATVYSMTKGGLEAMTRSLARELGAHGTTVNAVGPGLVSTDMISTWSEEDIAAEAAAAPVQKRIGQPDDVAQVVAWLASEGSRWVSGQTISATGAAVLLRVTLLDGELNAFRQTSCVMIGSDKAFMLIVVVRYYQKTRKTPFQVLQRSFRSSAVSM